MTPYQYCRNFPQVIGSIDCTLIRLLSCLVQQKNFPLTSRFDSKQSFDMSLNSYQKKLIEAKTGVMLEKFHLHSSAQLSVEIITKVRNYQKCF